MKRSDLVSGEWLLGMEYFKYNIYYIFQPSSKKKKEQERSEALINRLQEEKKRQDDNHQLVLGWLRQEKDSWLNPSMSFITKSINT